MPQAPPLEAPPPPSVSPLVGPNVEGSKLVPFDGQGVEKVLSLDLASQRHENESIYPQTFFKLGLGQDQISPGYVLLKDDDTFKNVNTSNLLGASLEVAPSWKFYSLSGPVVTTFGSVLLSGGYFQGPVSVQRTGVQNYTQTLTYQIIPIDVAFQVGVEFWGMVDVYASYGAGVEFLHQNGLGLLDSVSDIMYGDILSLGVSYNLSRSMQVFLSFKDRGVGLTLHPSTPISGKMFLAGISFALSG